MACTVSNEAYTGVSVYLIFMLHVSCKGQERRVSGLVACHKESISPHVLTRSGCRYHVPYTRAQRIV